MVILVSRMEKRTGTRVWDESAYPHIAGRFCLTDDCMLMGNRGVPSSKQETLCLGFKLPLELPFVFAGLQFPAQIT